MITEPVLVDTGPLVALLSEADQYHEICTAQSQELNGPAYTCLPVLTEAAYLLRNTPFGLNRLLELCDGEDVSLLSITQDDFAALHEISAIYHDQGFQFADLCLMHLAQRERIRHIFTLDRRHFSVYQPRFLGPLVLLPEATQQTANCWSGKDADNPRQAATERLTCSQDICCTFTPTIARCPTTTPSPTSGAAGRGRRGGWRS